LSRYVFGRVYIQRKRWNRYREKKQAALFFNTVEIKNIKNIIDILRVSRDASKHDIYKKNSKRIKEGLCIGSFLSRNRAQGFL